MSCRYDYNQLMPRQIAFLRAINVGGHTVTMADLRRHFEALGYANVETFIASGNVLFDSPKKPAVLEREIEAGLAKALGYEVATFVRTPAQVAAIAAYQPFGGEPVAKGHSLYATLLKAEPDAEAQKRVLALQSAVDAFHFHGREFYWHRRGGHDSTKFSGAQFERLIKAPGTARNINTFVRLAAKR